MPADHRQPLRVRRLLLLCGPWQARQEGHHFVQLELLLHLLALQGEHHRVQQLVLLEEAPADHDVQQGDEGSEQLREALVLAVLCLRLVDGLPENGNEPVQRELVHGIHDAEVADDEVHRRAPQGVGLVDLAHLRDRLRRHFLLLDLLLDLGAHDLRVAQGLDELLVVQDVARGRAQEGQDLVLLFLQRGLGLGGLDHQVHALFLRGRLLGRHDDAQHLVLQAIHGRHEIEDADGHADLGWEVRVGKLGRHVQLKVGRPLDGRVSQAHHGEGALFEGCLLQHGVQDGIEHLLDVFQQYGISELDGVLQVPDVVHVQTQDLELGALGLLHPLVGLHLRVDHERPPSGVVEDDGVVDAELVVRQRIDHPLADLHLVADAVREGELFARGDLQPLQLRDPAVHGLPAVQGGEDAQVGDDTRRDQDVSGEVRVVLAEPVALRGPGRLLAAQAVDQLLRARQLRGAILLIPLQLLRLLVGLVQLRLQIADHGFHLGELGLLGGHRRLGLGHLRLGLCQLQLLGADLLGHLVVHDHRSDPLADAHRRERGFLDLVGLELWVFVQRPHLCDDRLRYVVLVEVDHPLDQARVRQEILLGGLPIIIDLALAIWGGHLDRLHFEHDAHCLRRHVHTRGRHLHAAHLAHVALRQLAQRIHRGLVRGHRCLQVLRAVRLDLRGGGLLHVGLGLLLLHNRLLLHGPDLLLFHALPHLACLLGRLLQHGLQLVELDLQGGDLLLGVVDLLEAGVVPPLGLLHNLPAALQSADEGVDQLQVGRRRHVVVPLELHQEPLGQVGHSGLRVHHDLDHVGPDGIVELEVLVFAQELVCDSLESLGWPLVEPVDRAAVDQAREAAQAVAERRPDGRHRDHHVEVLPTLLDVPREDLGRPRAPRGAGALAALLGDLHFVLVRIQVGHLAGVEDRAHLLQEGFLGDLRVGEQEDHVLVSAARFHQQPLHVVVPLVQSVALGHLDLEELVLGDVGRQGGRGLAPAASHADQQGVAKGQPEDADHPADVLDERGEEHEVHADLADGVVVLQALRDLGRQPLVVHYLHVAGALGVNEVCKYDRLHLHNLVVWPLEVAVHLALAQAEEPHQILLADQAVLKYTLALVRPDLDEVVHLRKRLARALADTLEDLGDVSHVERVVGLRRRRQHLLQDRVVHLQRGGDGGRSRPGDVSGHDGQELVDHGGEDPVEALVVEWRDEDQVEVAGVPVRDVVLASPWWTHGREHVDVDQVAELPALPVVPPVAEGSLDEHLPQDLDRGLRTVRLLEGHVQIVDEDEHLLPGRGAEGALLLLVQLAVDHVLRLVRCGLRRKGEGDRAEEIGRESRQQHALDRRCLGSASWATDQNIERRFDQCTDQELIPNRVRCGNHDGVVWRVLWNVEARDTIRPWLPLPSIRRINEQIVHQPLARRAVSGATTCQLNLLKVLHEIELFQKILLVVLAATYDFAYEGSAIGVGAGPAGPHHREPKQLNDHRLTIGKTLPSVCVFVNLFTLLKFDGWFAVNLSLILNQRGHQAICHGAQPTI
mmetsp:Transcript_21643/g.60151  ORF Transcript_21643/g.60151 Transcript_21643/m.60151 type:complete len:1518 (+) Transcript_21643:2277-6830(+)